MKELLRLLAVLGLVSAASCNHSIATPGPATETSFGIARSDSLPWTLHVIPFYSYGKSGYEPLAGAGGRGALIGDATALYGSTASGGSTKCSTPFDTGSTTGCGIVYRLAPKTGMPTYRLDVLHTFKGAPRDGAASFATLFADKSGDLYGTTFYGGQYDGGTLFKLHPTSSGYTETIVHSFGSGQDGAYPVSAVVDVNGLLYGTTIGGGVTVNQGLCKTYGGSPNGTCGTVYRVNPATGAEHVLHSFGKSGDGSSPYTSLLDVGGTLYGTTDLGGSTTFCGTVFSINADGSNERVVHSFLNAGFGDGCNPFGSLIALDGTLYGTTCCGGGNFCSTCEGTLYSVDPSTGKERVLYEFGRQQDGSEPIAAVVNVHGVLYGTTNIGGTGDCNGYGCGVVFSFLPSPTNPVYAVLYHFTGGDDGGKPGDALLYSHGVFYGTTTYGGKNGLGTADKLSP